MPHESGRETFAAERDCLFVPLQGLACRLVCYPRLAARFPNVTTGIRKVGRRDSFSSFTLMCRVARVLRSTVGASAVLIVRRVIHGVPVGPNQKRARNASSMYLAGHASSDSFSRPPPLSGPLISRGPFRRGLTLSFCRRVAALARRLAQRAVRFCVIRLIAITDRVASISARS